MYSLVLGGGAARGFVHIGLRSQLQKHCVHPSECIGTSIGAIIASAIATGIHPDTMIDLANQWIPHRFGSLDFVLKNGLIGGNKIRQFLGTIFGSIRIEDTQIPLTIVATDIDRGISVPFREGLLVDALRASIAIPGIFEPVKINGSWYIDGGVTANLPIQYASNNYVCASSCFLGTHDRHIDLVQSRWNQLGQEFWGVNYSLLAKSLDLLVIGNEKSSYEGRKKDKILLCTPRLHCGLFAFGEYMKSIEIGSQYIQSIKSSQKFNQRYQGAIIV